MKPVCDRPETGKPCVTCPFLTANYNKPNPEGYDPKTFAANNPDRNFYDWFGEKNLRRLWKDGISQGEVLMCHATDPNAESYGGKSAKQGNERPCVGALILVVRHIKRLEELTEETGNIKTAKALYRKEAGKYPMNQRGIVEWAMMLMIGRTSIFGGLALPRSTDSESVEACGVPWTDSIVNKPAA